MADLTIGLGAKSFTVKVVLLYQHTALFFENSPQHLTPMAVFEGTFDHASTANFAFVIGRFNDLVTTKLLEGCQDCLKRHGVDIDPHGSQVDYAWVPGSFEVPVVARQLALSGKYDAIICLGAVIRGQTPHFDYVAAEVSKGIAAASFQTGVPVVFGILTTDTMQQALERAGIKSNQGWNYAMSALEMSSLMAQVRTANTQPVISPGNVKQLAAEA